MLRRLMLLPVLAAAMATAAFAEEGPPADAEQRRMDEVLRARQVKAEADRIAGNHALETGRQLRAEGRLEDAVRSFELAVRLLKDSSEARDELQSARSALGVTRDRTRDILQELDLAKKAREDQQRVVVEGKAREGERLMAERKFADAVRVLKEAQETVRWMNYGSEEVERWRLEVSRMLAEAERGAAEESQRRRDTQMREAAAAVSRDYDQSRQQIQRRVAALRQAGSDALKAQNWTETERVAREIDQLLPGDAGAAHLKLLSRERRHAAVRDATRKSYDEEWGNLREFATEQRIPYSREGEIMRHPANWDEIQRRGERAAKDQKAEEPQWKQQLREKLTKTVRFQFDGVLFPDAKQYLENQGRVVINVAKPALEAVPNLDETPIKLASPQEGMSLQSALDTLMRQVGLEWILREETIVVTTKDDIKEKPVLTQYDVRDLLGQVQDYIAPAISMGGSGGGGSPGVTFDQTVEADEQKNITGETLMDFIKEYVDKSIWGEAENSIQFRNGKLFVTAPGETHNKILEVLKGFREQRTLQVLIQTRFIQIDDTSFENIGVDWKGLGSGGPVLDDVTNLTTAAGTGNAGQAGFMNPRGLRTDIKTSVGNSGQFLGGVFPRTFGGAMNTAGGFGAQIAFLDNFQAQAVIEAVEKNRKANTLTAPTLLCFNTQRANMVSVTQQAYIQDITAVVQVQAVGYDPEIGYVQTGIVFDVRPIVSADRKYITLELRPTISELKQIRTVFTSGAVTTVAGNQSNIFVEAPIVTMNAIRTTVSVPDGGTLMIGGLTDADETHNYAAVPFVSKIPFLKSLFSTRADGNNRRSIVILVKAQIIDQREIEEQQFGKE